MENIGTETITVASTDEGREIERDRVSIKERDMEQNPLAVDKFESLCLPVSVN